MPSVLLDDKNLPSVPPLQLSIPADYPDQSPQWADDSQQYGTRTDSLSPQHVLNDLLRFREVFSLITFCLSVSSGANPFLQKVHRNMTTKLLQLPDKHSVTAVLNTWAQSVRQACLSVA